MTRTSCFSRLLVCSILMILWSVGASAEIIYVKQGEGVYQTIQAGVTAAAVGDTVLVGAGSYQGFTVDKQLRIIGEEGPDSTLITSGGPVIFSSTADGSLISGFTITNPAGSGIDVQNGCDYLRIENNIIASCGTHGVLATRADEQHLTYLTIVNNTISSNSGSGVYVLGNACVNDGGRFRNFLFGNNTFHNNSDYGIASNCASAYFESCLNANNSFWFNAAGPTLNGVGASVSDGNLFVDPLFIDPETGDFHLASMSSCIDAGKVGAAYQDPDGTRNDMGVYGGPGAVNWWPYPAGGPVVIDLSVTPPSVPAGGTLTLQATGSIR